ncbi:MAG: FG-GAP-like repeat-containing protein [Bacteroidales bacterium]
MDLIELYPNWPVQLVGNSSRGGIYCNLDEDDELEIVYNVEQQVYAWNVDGSVVDGWPQTVQLFPDGAPAFGDIDGDGEGEIVVSTRSAGTGNTGRLHAFHKDGTVVSGFPVTLIGGTTKTPVLADLNGDNTFEIILEERAYPNGYVGVYKGDGTSYPGFPVTLDYIPGSAVAVGDITGDNIPEIIAESYYSIYALDVNGNVLEGFPFTPGNDRVFSYSTPVLADLDGDGKREIIAGDHSSAAGNGAVHVLKYDGSFFPGWPKYTGYWIYGPPAVGDIDGDGSLDIAIGDQVLSGTPVSKVFVWDKDGNALPGWPTTPIWAINNQILLADLDGDNSVELMWDDNTDAGVYLGYNHDGTPMDEWPLTVTGSTFFMNPFVTDINNDGLLDISGAGRNLITSEINFYLWNANVPVNSELAELPVLQYNVQHDGVYIDVNVLNANFVATPIALCEQEETQFSDQSNGDVVSWEWEFPGGYPNASVEQNPIIWYGTEGEYDVTLTVSDGTNSHTTTKANYIKVAYEPEVPDQPTGPVVVETSQNLFTFYETSSLNADEYVWELIPDDMGLIVPGDTLNEVKIYWSQSNSYQVQLSARAINACGESELSEPLVIYVNWNTQVENQLSDNIIKMYPNPSRDNFFVEMTVPCVRVELLLVDGFGRQFIPKYLICNERNLITIEAGNIPKGVYFVVVKAESYTKVKKLVLIE